MIYKNWLTFIHAGVRTTSCFYQFAVSGSLLSSCEHLPAEATPISGIAFHPKLFALAHISFRLPFVSLHSSLLSNFLLSSRCANTCRCQDLIYCSARIHSRLTYAQECQSEQIISQENEIVRNKKGRTRRSSTVQNIYSLFVCDARLLARSEAEICINSIATANGRRRNRRSRLTSSASLSKDGASERFQGHH